MFSMHFDHQRDHFAIFNYFSLVDVFLKKSNSKKYILEVFASISHFLITFLFKLKLRLLFMKKLK